MTKVLIDPGVCGFVTRVEAQADAKRRHVTLKVHSGCESIQKMMAEAGDTFESFSLCLARPGGDPLHQYASEHFPAHASCPILVGILKCAEVEAGLGLKKDASIHFEEV